MSQLSYEKIMSENPYVLHECKEFNLVEHPIYGDEHSMIGVDHKNKIAWATGFYDLDGGSDIQYIYEMWHALVGGCDEK
jgi:hypothetical protein